MDRSNRRHSGGDPDATPTTASKKRHRHSPSSRPVSTPKGQPIATDDIGDSTHAKRSTSGTGRRTHTKGRGVDADGGSQLSFDLGGDIVGDPLGGISSSSSSFFNQPGEIVDLHLQQRDGAGNVTGTMQGAAALEITANPTTALRLTRYEMTKIVAFRAKQIMRGARLTAVGAAAAEPNNGDPLGIAKAELAAKVLPYLVRRDLPVAAAAEPVAKSRTTATGASPSSSRRQPHAPVQVPATEYLDIRQMELDHTLLQ